MAIGEYEVEHEEVQRTQQAIARVLKKVLPAGWGFTFFLFEFEGSALFYMSDGDREVISMIGEIMNVMSMDIMDPSGHLTLSWDPADPASVQRARDEFERLRGLGYAFFASPDDGAPRVIRLKAAALTQVGTVDVRVMEQVREFRPRARRTVAMRPMVGG